MTRLRIRTPSRLHFGLLGWGKHSRRQFGGVGLMIDEPCIELAAEHHTRWDTRGPLADRTLATALIVSEQLALDGNPVTPLRLTVLQAPHAHIGLGVGTQLSLATARLVAELSGRMDISVQILARMTGRGHRSGIGLHGFREGGLIVDVGRQTVDDLPTKLVRLPFPSEWSILLVLPDASQGLHGADESQAFHTLPTIPEAITNHLCSLVMLGILPAVLETDLNAFGLSLTEMQELVGSIFAPAQGGRFAFAGTESVIQTMKEAGLRGVGQSSWGPALYGFSDGGREERESIRIRIAKSIQISLSRIVWTQANNHGATLNSD